MTHIIKVVTLSISLAIGMGESQAGQSASGQEQLSIRYEDLNLNSPSGAERMFARLQAGASKVCGERPDLRDLSQRGQYRSCLTQAMDGAVTQLGSPLVSALYYGQAPSQVAMGK